MNSSNYQEFVVWGLSNRRHSHRFVHKGFFQNLSTMYPDVLWLPDSKNVELSPFKRRLIVASGMASSNLPILPNTDYVLHNVHLTEKQLFSAEVLRSKVLYLQVYTTGAKGEKFWHSPYATFDLENRTLYQPWGTPLTREEWTTSPSTSTTNSEFWVGAVWNNKQNQGNLGAIRRYKEVLESNSIKFRRVGGSRVTKDGISEAEAADLVRKSRVGASIVGEWQQECGYVPCRIFKNIAAGVAPISNGNYQELFGDSQMYSEDLEILVGNAISEPFVSKAKRLKEAQEVIEPHTYRANIQRILEALSYL
jgi:hypothetical protein